MTDTTGPYDGHGESHRRPQRSHYPKKNGYEKKPSECVSYTSKTYQCSKSETIGQSRSRALSYILVEIKLGFESKKKGTGGRPDERPDGRDDNNNYRKYNGQKSTKRQKPEVRKRKRKRKNQCRAPNLLLLGTRFSPCFPPTGLVSCLLRDDEPACLLVCYGSLAAANHRRDCRRVSCLGEGTEANQTLISGLRDAVDDEALAVVDAVVLGAQAVLRVFTDLFR